MARFRVAIQALVAILGVVLVGLGIWIWTGHGAAVVPTHIRLGFLLVLVLCVSAVLAAHAGASTPRVIAVIVLALLLPVVGLGQTHMLVGQSHWVIQVVHLALGVAAVGLAQSTAAAVRRRM